MRKLLTTALFTLLAGAACAPSDSAPTDAPDNVSDELEGLMDLYKSGKDLDLGDLLSIGSGFATDKLNDALAVSPYASIQIAPTELYTTSARAQGDLTLKDLNALVSGLTSRFGERELTTEVNALRLAHLEGSNDTVYAESAFTVAGGVHDWGTDVGGFEQATVRLGFSANATLEARTVRAYGKESSAQVQSPLASIKESAGFVLPRNVGDIKNLKPGESFALRGHGSLGANLGLGVPILVASSGAVSYSIVLSAGLRARFDGAIDVQLVRMDGDEAVIDVGVETSSLREGRIAIRDGWGISGLVKEKVSLGGQEIDLGKLAENALKSRVLDKLSLVSATLEKTKRSSRISVARLRFSLDSATPGSPVETALAHALRADLRLAQALANRQEPGVKADFELLRSGVASTSYAGIDLLGMSFFRKVQEAQGSVTVETPGGARTVLFQSLYQESGSFFSRHGYGRTGLSGLVFDPSDPSATEGEANLLLQVVEGDDFMERDKLLDHLDGLIRAVGGDKALAAIEPKGNELQRYVVAACPNSQAFDPCRESVLSDPKVVALRAEGRAALSAELGHLEAEQRALVEKAGDLRLTAQATLEPAAQLVGPGTSIALDYRLDDGALRSLFLDRTPAEVASAARGHFVLAGLNRGASVANFTKQRSDLEATFTDVSEAMADVFEGSREEYAHLVELSALPLPKHPELGPLGAAAVELRFPEKSGKPDYVNASLKSIPQARAAITTKMFDKLLGVARVKGAPHPEQTVAYTLMTLTQKNRLDVRFEAKMNIDDGFAQDFGHYRTAGYADLVDYARGSAVSPIDGGLFNVDQLVNVAQ